MSNSNGTADRKEKNKLCHHPWSVLLSTVALDQSAREKSFSYCKIKVFRYSFSEAILVFFNRFKSDFLLV